uniref:Uncharacterized protein n=1 Tax=Neolamprologus brichardi TaxID=32507 RepID=A0A3Q4N3A3_NEOBR
MTSYHKPDEKTLQGLKDVANKLRINSIKATCASNSGPISLPSPPEYKKGDKVPSELLVCPVLSF